MVQTVYRLSYLYFISYFVNSTQLVYVVLCILFWVRCPCYITNGVIPSTRECWYFGLKFKVAFQSCISENKYWTVGRLAEVVRSNTVTTTELCMLSTSVQYVLMTVCHYFRKTNYEELRIIIASAMRSWMSVSGWSLLALAFGIWQLLLLLLREMRKTVSSFWTCSCRCIFFCFIKCQSYVSNYCDLLLQSLSRYYWTYNGHVIPAEWMWW